ncbi:MAG: DUF1674 domain-containing protein [Xanthobacteraceae bacterium]
MPTDHPLPDPSASKAAGSGAGEKRQLSAAAQRALAEAAARRAAREQEAANPPTEVNGRGGVDPTRYGDWEINGLATDF